MSTRCAGALSERLNSSQEGNSGKGLQNGSVLKPLATPDDIYLTAELPKTRSGKIMRRLLRDIAEGRALGDTTTLADPGVVSRLRAKYEDSSG
jgi:acyl-CoA synthetase (AMP-forming)/AMP-acid ligase II